jgi:hypothetical protein
MFVGECFYHEKIVICHVTHVNRARAENRQGAKVNDGRFSLYAEGEVLM